MQSHITLTIHRQTTSPLPVLVDNVGIGDASIFKLRVGVGGFGGTNSYGRWSSPSTILLPKCLLKLFVLIVEDVVVDKENFLLLWSKRRTTGILAGFIRLNTQQACHVVLVSTQVTNGRITLEYDTQTSARGSDMYQIDSQFIQVTMNL